MADHRLETFTRDATRGIVPPDFAALVRSARARRRRAVVAGGVVAAAALGLAAAGLRPVLVDRGAPAPPVGGAPSTSATPSPAPPSATPTPTPMVEGWQQVIGVAADPESPGVLAVLDAGCLQSTCSGATLTVTRDSFATGHRLPVDAGVLSWVGGDDFLVCAPGPQPASPPVGELVSSDGAVARLQVDTTPGPLADGERLVRCAGQGDYFYGVDPASRTAHPVTHGAGGPGGVSSMQRTAGGVLWGTVPSAGPVTVLSSTDRGRTWSSHRPALPTGPATTYSALPSGDARTLAVLAAAPDAGSWSLARSTDAGASWTTVRPSGFAGTTLGWAVVRPDGSLLVDVSSSTRGARRTGLYASNGGDWTTLAEVSTDLPPDAVRHGELQQALVDGSGAQALYVSTQSAQAPRVSTDGGHRWTPVTARPPGQ